MRRFAPVLLIVALAATACAKSGSTTTTAGVTTTTAGATTSTAAATTTTAAPSTTADPSAARVAAAMAMAGDYTGAWHNTTFGSTGSVDATLAVDADAKSAILTLDLGGNVFGQADPDPTITEFDLTQDGPVEGTNDLLGDYTITIDPDGTLTLEASAVPSLGGLPMEVTGMILPGAMSFTYTIHSADGGTFAEGTIDIAPSS